MLTELETINRTVAALKANSEELSKAIVARQQQIDQARNTINDLNTQIEQHRGAVSYNTLLIQSFEKQVADLIAAEKAALEDPANAKSAASPS